MKKIILATLFGGLISLMFGGCGEDIKRTKKIKAFDILPTNGQTLSKLNQRLYCRFNVVYGHNTVLLKTDGKPYLCEWSEEKEDYIFKGI